MVLLELSNYLYFVGLAFGVSSSTFLNILFIKSKNDKDILKIQRKLMHFFIDFFCLSLILVILSLILFRYFEYNFFNSEILLINYVLVFWLIILCYLLKGCLKKIGTFAPIGKEEPKPEYLSSRMKMKLFNYINLVVWYLLMFLSLLIML